MLVLEKKMSLESHAKKEFLIAGYEPLSESSPDDPNTWIQQNVLELLEVFSKQGHSGMSAPYVITVFEKLARFEVMTPLTGEDSEWNDVSAESGEPHWQNNRASNVFKGADGRAYNIDGTVFWSWYTPDDGGEKYKSHWTDKDSRVYVEFPYTPVTVYVEKSEGDE